MSCISFLAVSRLSELRTRYKVDTHKLAEEKTVLERFDSDLAVKHLNALFTMTDRRGLDNEMIEYEETKHS